MCKQKKDALTLACEELETRTSCPKDLYDFDCDCENTCNNNYTQCWKQYFQQQADIPDGWDVVKEIYKMTYVYYTDRHIERFIENKLEKAGLLESTLEEAGMEVCNEV